MGTSGPPGSEGGSKAPLVLGIAFLLLLFLIGGAVLLLMSGGDSDDGRDDEASASEPADDDEVEDASDDFDDFSDDFSDDDDDSDEELDTDLDGIPDAQDPDDDDDGVPDIEDRDDDGDGIPDDDDDVGDGDGEDEVGEPGDDDDPDEEDPPADLDLLRNDPSPAIDAFQQAAGRATPTVEVSLYPTYAFLQVKDADRPQGTLDWAWRDGELEGPETTTPFPGTDLDAETFPLGAPNWDALPRLVANAPERARLARGEVTHVIVTSDAPFSNRFLFRIYVTAPNGSDYVIATIDGRPAER